MSISSNLGPPLINNSIRVPLSGVDLLEKVSGIVCMRVQEIASERVSARAGIQEPKKAWVHKIARLFRRPFHRPSNSRGMTSLSILPTKMSKITTMMRRATRKKVSQRRMKTRSSSNFSASSTRLTCTALRCLYTTKLTLKAR